jgi:sulfate permease, SulP family
VVIFAALRLIDVAGFRRITRFRRSEAVIAVVTAVAVLGVGVLYGSSSRWGSRCSTYCTGWPARTTACWATCPGWPGCTTSTTTRTPDRCPACSYTATTRRCASPTPRTSAAGRWLRAGRCAGPPRWFLLNAEANVEIDSTAAEGLAALHGELARRGVVLALARFKHELHADLRTAGLLDVVGDDRVFMTLPIAVQAFHRSCGHSGETGQGCHTEPAGSDLGATSGPSTPTSRVRRTCSGPSSRRTLDP